MSAKYTRLGQLEAKFGVPAREYLTARDFLPVTSTLNCYKILSSTVANRIEPILPNIINPDRTGFIAGRIIGENTRFIYDTIHQCEVENKEGILVILDFAKAFDTLE